MYIFSDSAMIAEFEKMYIFYTKINIHSLLTRLQRKLHWQLDRQLKPVRQMY